LLACSWGVHGREYFVLMTFSVPRAVGYHES
jgi:hypothetical protein